MAVRLVKADGFILVRLLLHAIVVIIVVIPVLVCDSSIAIVVKVKHQVVFSTIFTAKIVLAAEFLLDLLQAALLGE